jgi:DNA-binding CsgD family transcriptional regulator
MALSSSLPLNDTARVRRITRSFGDIMLLSQYIHELLMVHALNKTIGPPDPIPVLTRRERECLMLAAQGLTSEDISRCMCISKRTVQLHCDSFRSKLGAANRQEAVALAIKRGIIVI